MGTGVDVQCNDTPHEHAGMLSLDSLLLKVSEGSTVVLCINGRVRVLEHQC
jgi:hypothetical protein